MTQGRPLFDKHISDINISVKLAEDQFNSIFLASSRVITNVCIVAASVSVSVLLLLGTVLGTSKLRTFLYQWSSNFTAQLLQGGARVAPFTSVTLSDEEAASSALPSRPSPALDPFSQQRLFHSAVAVTVGAMAVALLANSVVVSSTASQVLILSPKYQQLEGIYHPHPFSKIPLTPPFLQISRFLLQTCCHPLHT